MVTCRKSRAYTSIVVYVAMRLIIDMLLKLLFLLVIVPINTEEASEDSNVRYVELSSGYKIPRLGLGTWHAKSQLLENALEVALEAGYRLVDTALVYGSERTIGQVVKKWIDSGRLNRSDIFIITKLPAVGNRPEYVQKYLNQSLKNLQMDYVDLYLVHTPFGFNFRGEGILHPHTPDGYADLDLSTDIVAVWKAMEEQVDAGLTRSIGLSNFNQTQIERILNNSRIRPANLQVEVHAFFQQRDLLKFCKKEGIVVTAYSPLRSPSTTKFRFDGPGPLDDMNVIRIATKYNKTEAQILLRHGIQRGLVCIPKSTTPERLRENIDIFDFELASEDMEILNSLNQEPEGRILSFTFSRGITSHPEYPFDLRYVKMKPLNLSFFNLE